MSMDVNRAWKRCSSCYVSCGPFSLLRNGGGASDWDISWADSGRLIAVVENLTVARRFLKDEWRRLLREPAP